MPTVGFQSAHQFVNQKSKIKNRQCLNALSFRKLEPFPSTLLSVLLAFLDARIARHQAGVFKGRTQVSIELKQRARDAVPDRSCLTRRSTAGDVDYEVKLAGRFSQLQRLTNDHSQRFVREITFERFSVYLDFA